jgi:hypothetical protein
VLNFGNRFETIFFLNQAKNVRVFAVTGMLSSAMLVDYF